MIRGSPLGVPVRRTIVFRRLYWAPPISGNYQIKIAVPMTGGMKGFHVSFEEGMRFRV